MRYMYTHKCNLDIKVVETAIEFLYDTLKRLPFSSHEELTRQYGVLKLTNIMGNKSIPKFCKLNLISLCYGAGKI